MSNEINTGLPSWLRFSGEERARLESIVGENFKPIMDVYLLNRLRLNMQIRALSWLKFNFQAEDSRVFGQNTQPAPASQKDAMDLRLAYVQVGSEEGPATLVAGRQSLTFGEGRLVGDPGWSNVGRSFDGARLTLRHAKLKLDLFSAAWVKIDPVNFDEPMPGEHFDGAYGSLGGLVPNVTIEPYMFWRLEHNYKNEGGTLGNLDEKTVGLRWVGKLPAGLDYGAEFAGQTGSWAGDPIGAYMQHWVLGETLPDARHKPRFFVEYNRASGDDNPKDRYHGTFDPLFPIPHDMFGLTDLMCSSNIVYLRPGFQYTLRPRLTVGVAYDDYWLDSARDGLYIGGKSFVRNANGTAGTHVGQEADVQGQWAISGATTLNAGYGRLIPGEFLQRTTAGMPYNLFFLGLTQKL